MIVDDMKHAPLYSALSPGIETALRYLASTDLHAVEPGKHELGGGCFAILQDYETVVRGKKRWEAHRQYIDVQFIVRGEEMIGYAPCSALRPVEAYDGEKDVEWFEGYGGFVVARAGMFVILYPDDAHMPGKAAGEPSMVRKVVVKVPVDTQQ